MKKLGMIVLVGGLIAGCGNADDPSHANFATVPVSGKVTAKGQPVTSGLVILVPVANSKSVQQATGEIKPDGTFALNSPGGKAGAMPGEYLSHLEKLDGSTIKGQAPVPITISEQGGDIEIAF